MSVNLSKHSAMATSARPDETAQAASRNATSPVADAFSMWVTGSPVSPSSFMALMPSMEAGWMYPTKASSTSAKVMPASWRANNPASRARWAPGFPEHAEAHHADTGDGHGVEAESLAHDAAPLVDAAPSTGRKR